MKNIELKAVCKNLQQLKETVLYHGGNFERKMHHVDTYFNAPKGRLKLREIDDNESVLIFYERADTAESKESNYYIYNSANPAALKEVLEKTLGIKIIVDKIRELYIYKNTRIHLDTVQGLGTFMELETVIKSQTYDEAVQEHNEVKNFLGIETQDLLEKSYSDLILALQK